MTFTTVYLDSTLLRQGAAAIMAKTTTAARESQRTHAGDAISSRQASLFRIGRLTANYTDAAEATRCA